MPEVKPLLSVEHLRHGLPDQARPKASIQPSTIGACGSVGDGRVLDVHSFCRDFGARHVFLKGNRNEARTLVAWLRLAGPEFSLCITASPDWMFIAPRHRREAVLRPFAEALQQMCPWHTQARSVWTNTNC